MKKVYIVWFENENPYENPYFESVYDTERKAKNFVKSNSNKYYYTEEDVE